MPTHTRTTFERPASAGTARLAETVEPGSFAATTVTERGEGFVKMSYTGGDGVREPGSDSALLAQGFACVTPLLAPCEDSSVDTTGLAAGR